MRPTNAPRSARYPHLRGFLVASLACSATLALAACGSDDTPTPAVPSYTKIEETSSAESAQAADGTAAGTPASATTSQSGTESKPASSTSSPGTSSEAPRECASLPKDPRQVYASGTAPGRMPGVGSDMNFWIDDIDNAYDPCAPLSWIIFRGANGDLRGPAGTGASIGDGLALYVHGAPANEMVEFEKVESVTPLPDGAVELTWGERSQGTAAGITAHHSVRIEASGKGVRAVDGDVDLFNRFWNDPQMQFQLGTYD